ncbi:unnamed protein product [Arctia plantaginis]|uniref:Uncharacterized protein n=1 Tax=Arctia plantaginis TaxID=874455 RepID=A0A8S0ZJ33_ARCPL|nr:unnamed protein product [Arctia plantaginis]CAB3238109.1 unnamed protein product [Arctia plantaginis]
MAGIHVQGHLDVGQGLVQLFNGLVEQFEINPKNDKRVLDDSLEVKLGDDQIKDDGNLHIVDSPHAGDQKRIGDEVPLLEQLRNQREESVHLYGHHRLSYTNGYHIKDAVPVDRDDDVLKFAQNIMQELGPDYSVDEVHSRASGSLYNMFKNIGMNILKTVDAENSDKALVNDHYKPSRPHKVHYLAEDFIKILIKFDHKPLERAWEFRPDIKAFKFEDLMGDPADKFRFLKHLKIAGDMYKSIIDLCEAQQFTLYNRTIPNHLIVTDLITMADSYKVDILSNTGIPVDIYENWNLIDGSLTVDDVLGRAEDRETFVKSVKMFGGEVFQNAFDNISTHLYGIPVPDHLYTEWVIATAKNLNVTIVSNKGKQFNMNWHYRPDDFIGYPADSFGGLDFVDASLLEGYKITGHAEFIAKGNKIMHFINEKVKDINWNADNIRKLWNAITSGEVEINNEPASSEDSNELTKPRRHTNGLKRGPPSKVDPLSRNYPANYPELSAFTMNDLTGKVEDKKRFLEFIKDVAPVYRLLISSLNAEYLQKHKKQYPITMVAHDFVQLADHFNVKIHSNGGKTYNIDWNSMQTIREY